MLALLLLFVGLSEFVSRYVNMKECDMGRGDDPRKIDRVATIETLKEKERGIMTMSPQ